MYSVFHHELRKWYAAHGRHGLPWRNTSDAYAIWISEVMLQQTQVKTVLERYYFPFLERFPTLQSLADASLDTVLKAWEGLGYYTRAANLHKAARIAAPNLPSTVQELEALPGIGRNTAHAIAAFAYRKSVPVMEANVRRIISRIFSLSHPSAEILWQKAADLIDAERSFDYNQAMMDLGSMICTPRNPLCPLCPASSICQGKGDPESYPAKQTKKKVPVRRATIMVCRDASGRYFLEPRKGKFLHGLYGFADCGYKGTEKPLGHVSQTYSHFKAEADVFLMEVPSLPNEKGWYAPESFDSLALSGIDKKISALIHLHSWE